MENFLGSSKRKRGLVDDERRATRQSRHDIPADTSLSTEAAALTPSLSNAPAIRIIPKLLTSKSTGLSKRDLKTLWKKQTWLQNYSVDLPSGSGFVDSLRSALHATLVFAQEEAGTAVCISPHGLILTCSHCIAENEEEYEELKIKWLIFASGRAVKTECIAWDPKRDLALLRIAVAQQSAAESFPFVHISLTPPLLHDPLVCIGHPGSEDLEASLPGIKTNYDVLYISTGKFRGLAKNQDLQDNSEIGALKHDCWTYWGHSGAPRVHMKTGMCVGLHSSWDERTGMRRGVPLEALVEFLTEFEGGREVFVLNAAV